jgi:hypothetical protein
MENVKSKPGRKTVEDKKEGVTVYVRPSEIKKIGGKDKLRHYINRYVQRLYNERP